MLDIFRNKLLGHKISSTKKESGIEHNNDLPFEESTSVGVLFYIKDLEQLKSTLNESRIIEKILPKTVKNLEIIFITEEKRIDFDVPFEYKIIPLSKINWNKKNVESHLQLFVKKKFDYLFTFTYGISKILDQLAYQSHSTCRIALGEHQDVSAYEMKLSYDQLSFTERIRESIDILKKMHK
ncbi:hypothetical protein [Flammeovirga sp. SubArs3]|uniref:DUF6913 domain-containing protein n=1 Tax=Flammeovirga sp. SubArs3 TaxID=2995316 RepID=UPI00248CB935|nr:hypothetical protein [Flammeovirga sp. SubArs3]